MIFSQHWIDVTASLLARVQPVFTLPREKAHEGDKAWAGQSQVGTMGEFWVPIGQLLGEDEVEFSLTTIGDAVRVPMHAYKVQRSLPVLFAFGVQIGMAAIVELRKHSQRQPTTVHLVIGHECTDLAPVEDSFQCYIGVALQTR